MSTLDVTPGALRAAVAPFPVVREVRATASFPHGLRITVVEQLPVAALRSGGTAHGGGRRRRRARAGAADELAADAAAAPTSPPRDSA